MARNVSKKTLNDMRRIRRKTFDLEAWITRENHRDFVLNRPGQSATKERYQYENFVKDKAVQLFDQYKSAGVTWAACVQAVKTDWISSFHLKWGKAIKS